MRSWDCKISKTIKRLYDEGKFISPMKGHKRGILCWCGKNHGHAWNYGLTKETDERIKKYAEGLRGPRSGKWLQHQRDAAKNPIRNINISNAKKLNNPGGFKRGEDNVVNLPEVKLKIVSAFKKWLETERGQLYLKEISERMRTNNPRKYCKAPSYPQLKLFELIKQKYPDAVLEYEVKINKNNSFFLDIAVPSQKLDFEYDGQYWHQNKEEDQQRDHILKNLGWKIIRINKENEVFV